MKKLFEIITSNFIVPTGWTLIHSIWQSLAIVLIISVLAYVFKSKSNIKYWLNISGLGLQLIVSFLTFSLIYQPTQVKKSIYFFEAGTLTTQNLSWIQQFNLFISSNIDLIVNLWLVGICFLILRFLFSFWYVNRLKISGIREVNQRVSEVLNGIVEKISFLQKVQIFESSKVSIPMVIGYLKPVILLPIGLASGLTNRQLEAILAHELAHIRRNDFVINLIQSIIEILYFFNPVIWFISSQIRNERENCCDDFAIELTGDKMLLVKALTQVENYRYEPSLAMAFGRKKYNLLDRVKRILGINPTKNSSIEGFIGSFLILFVIGIYFTYQKANAQSTKPIIKEEKSVKSEKTERTSTAELGHSVKVTDDGEVFYEKTKVKVTPQDSIDLVYHQRELRKLHAQMQPYQDKMSELGREMQSFGEKMQLLHQPINEKSKEMSALGNQLNKLSRQQVRLEFEIEDETNDKNRKDLETKLKQVESQIKEIEGKIDSFTDLIDKTNEKNELLYRLPMDSLSKLMEEYEKPIDELVKKIEEHGEALNKLIPEKLIHSNYWYYEHEPVAPVPPKRIIERPVKAPKAPIPPKMNSTIKEVPIPPKAPINVVPVPPKPVKKNN
jgi:bla regulator protein blaR1